MEVPKSKRVIYERNPLIEVVCQLRFPPILRLSREEPFEFQDEIRFDYPHFDTGNPQVPSEIANTLQRFNLPFPGDKSYAFHSEDRKWKISLAKDFLALTSFEYQRYESFKNRLQKIIEVFERIYKPSYYSRVGIRYKDLIRRSQLGLQDKDWSELIEKRIASELHDNDFSQSIQAIFKNLLLETDYGRVNFHHGLVNAQDQNNQANSEIAYLLDADFFTEEKMENKDDAWKRIDQFNKSAGDLFRWSITDILHNAMRPQPINRE